MGLSDFILFPFYLFLFYIFFHLRKKKYKNTLLQKYYKRGFWVKVLGTIAFTIFNVYISPGDSTGLYHKEGVNIYQLILQDSSNLKWLFTKGVNFDETLLKDSWNAGYFNADSNYLVTKVVAFLSFVTFGNYIVINLIFSLIAFTGAWKLFLFFYEQYPRLHKKFAIAILYFPTFVFWSSGILKEALCIGALGWLTYALYELFCRKKRIIKNSFIVLLSTLVLSVIKVYILISYVPFFVLFIILKNFGIVNNKAIKYLLAPLLIAVSLMAFNKVLNLYSEELGGYSVTNLTQSIKGLNQALESQAGSGTAESNFSLGIEFDGTATGLIKLAPIAIATTLFRPFLWESHKLSSLIASLESLVLMFLTIHIIFKAGPVMLMRYIFKDPLIMYCFLFSFFFALFIGASALNFGTLVRYKIPCMPFYLIFLFLVHERVMQKAKTKFINYTAPAIPGEILFAPAG